MDDDLIGFGGSGSDCTDSDDDVGPDVDVDAIASASLRLPVLGGSGTATGSPGTTGTTGTAGTTVVGTTVVGTTVAGTTGTTVDGARAVRSALRGRDRLGAVPDPPPFATPGLATAVFDGRVSDELQRLLSRDNLVGPRLQPDRAPFMFWLRSVTVLNVTQLTGGAHSTGAEYTVTAATAPDNAMYHELRAAADAAARDREVQIGVSADERLAKIEADLRREPTVAEKEEATRRAGWNLQELERTTPCSVLLNGLSPEGHTVAIVLPPGAFRPCFFLPIAPTSTLMRQYARNKFATELAKKLHVWSTPNAVLVDLVRAKNLFGFEPGNDDPREPLVRDYLCVSFPNAELCNTAARLFPAPDAPTTSYAGPMYNPDAPGVPWVAEEVCRQPENHAQRVLDMLGLCPEKWFRVTGWTNVAPRARLTTCAYEIGVPRLDFDAVFLNWSLVKASRPSVAQPPPPPFCITPYVAAEHAHPLVPNDVFTPPTLVTCVDIECVRAAGDQKLPDADVDGDCIFTICISCAWFGSCAPATPMPTVGLVKLRGTSETDGTSGTTETYDSATGTSGTTNTETDGTDADDSADDSADDGDADCTNLDAVGRRVARYGYAVTGAATVAPGDVFLRVCIVYGRSRPVTGAIVEQVDSETDLLLRFRDWVSCILDADVVVTYNGDRFDVPYIWGRARKLMMEVDVPARTWQNKLSGRSGVTPATYRPRTPFLRFFYLSRVVALATVAMKTKPLSSNAMGHNDIGFMQLVGRHTLDLFIFLKSQTLKLNTFTLNAVAAHFLQSGPAAANAKKHDVKPEHIFAAFRSTRRDMWKVAAYCAQDCDLPLLIIARAYYLSQVRVLSAVTYTSMDVLLTTGQQVKVFNQIVHYAHANGYLVNRMYDSTFASPKGEKYGGGTVLKPVAGFYETPVITLDFASLYPSIMCAHNLCYSSFVTPDTWKSLSGERASLLRENGGPLDVVQRVTASGKTHRFVQNGRGILPYILTALGEWRTVAKRNMAAATSAGDRAVYNGQQLALKISANSVYGFTGVNQGVLPCCPIAESVTAFGGEMILACKRLIETRYPTSTVIYGDTDSVMVVLDPAKFPTPDDVFREAPKAAAMCTALFKPPIKLEFEKVYMRYLLKKKKRYAGYLFESLEQVHAYVDGSIPMQGVKPPYVDKKGMKPARRDNCAWMRNLCNAILASLMDAFDPSAHRSPLGASTGSRIQRCIDMIRSAVAKLVAGEVPLADLVITGLYGGEYKNAESLPPHVVVGRAFPQQFSPGDRVPFVIVDTPNKDRVATVTRQCVPAVAVTAAPTTVGPPAFVPTTVGPIVQMGSVGAPAAPTTPSVGVWAPGRMTRKHEEAIVRWKKQEQKTTVSLGAYARHPSEVLENPRENRIDYVYYIEKQLWTALEDIVVQNWAEVVDVLEDAVRSVQLKRSGQRPISSFFTTSEPAKRLKTA